ncbi:hypothetical protein SEA_GINGERBUG_2 [Microbacterium phage Gingerbug]|nr:hypothetical protein SEA_GINGERBUG_2 [Microbacterium phage Gingerbug]
MSAYDTDCPAWDCPDISTADWRDGRRCAEHPCTCQDGRERPRTLQEAGEDLDAAFAALRAIWERPLIVVLRWTSTRLQRLGRWMRTR